MQSHESEGRTEQSETIIYKCAPQSRLVDSKSMASADMESSRQAHPCSSKLRNFVFLQIPPPFLWCQFVIHLKISRWLCIQSIIFLGVTRSTILHRCTLLMFKKCQNDNHDITLHAVMGVPQMLLNGYVHGLRRSSLFAHWNISSCNEFSLSGLITQRYTISYYKMHLNLLWISLQERQITSIWQKGEFPCVNEGGSFNIPIRSRC